MNQFVRQLKVQCRPLRSNKTLSCFNVVLNYRPCRQAHSTPPSPPPQSSSSPLRDASVPPINGKPEEYTGTASSYSSLKKSYVRPAIVFLLTAAGLFFYFRYEKSRMEHKKLELIKKSSGSVGEAKIGGPFSLLNQKSERVTERDLLGKYSLIYFGFTHCPDICPDELEKMKNVIDMLDKDKKTRDRTLPIFVTVDPRRDTPEKMAAYLKDFHPKLIGLTGTPQEILDFSKLYRVYCSQNISTEGSPDYLVDHSVFFYCMGPDGKFVDFFGSDMSADQIVERMKAHILLAKQN